MYNCAIKLVNISLSYVCIFKLLNNFIKTNPSQLANVGYIHLIPYLNFTQRKQILQTKRNNKTKSSNFDHKWYDLNYIIQYIIQKTKSLKVPLICSLLLKLIGKKKNVMKNTYAEASPGNFGCKLIYLQHTLIQNELPIHQNSNPYKLTG